eukprot:12884840-Prorocentrum_lima.AAC.1
MNQPVGSIPGYAIVPGSATGDRHGRETLRVSVFPGMPVLAKGFTDQAAARPWEWRPRLGEDWPG